MRDKGTRSGGWLFNEDDEAAIRSWPAAIAHYVWNRLSDNITILKYSGIRAEVCPFCIRYLDIDGAGQCGKCDWGLHHGRCANRKSDVHQVKNRDQFTNRYFRRLIKKYDPFN